MSTDDHEEPHTPWEISFTARVRADEIRFGNVPDTDVRFSGRPDHDSVRSSDRTNIPNKVEKTTYHDIEVDYLLACRLKCDESADDLPEGPDEDGPAR